MNKILFIPLHTTALVLSTLYKSKKTTFYSILTTITQDNFLHLLHSSLVIHILFSIVFSTLERTLGPLSESETMIYNEKVSSMLSDLILVISSFPQDIDMRAFIYFWVFYAVKSISWTYSIKAQRTYSRAMFVGGALTIFIPLSFAYLCLFPLQPRISIMTLFALEYSLISLDMVRTISIMALDLSEIMSRRSFYVFIISIFYYLLKAIAYFVFTFYVTIRYKLPMSSAKASVSALIKLGKKIKLFAAYLKLSRDLDSVEDVEIDGTCAICTDELVVGKMLKCRHSFHSDCLKMWCERETTCPICRAELVFRREEKIETEDEVISGVLIEE